MFSRRIANTPPSPQTFPNSSPLISIDDPRLDRSLMIRSPDHTAALNTIREPNPQPLRIQDPSIATETGLQLAPDDETPSRWRSFVRWISRPFRRTEPTITYEIIDPLNATNNSESRGVPTSQNQLLNLPRATQPHLGIFRSPHAHTPRALPESTTPVIQELENLRTTARQPWSRECLNAIRTLMEWQDTQLISFLPDLLNGHEHFSEEIMTLSAELRYTAIIPMLKNKLSNSGNLSDHTIKIAATLGKLGDIAGPSFLREHLGNPTTTPKDRSKIIEILGEIKAVSAVPDLISMIIIWSKVDENLYRSLCADAFKALSQIGDMSIIPFLQSFILEREEHPSRFNLSLVNCALHAMGKIGGILAIPFLQDFIIERGRSAQDIGDAIHVLGEAGGELVVPFLLQLDRYPALLALRNIGGTTVINAFQDRILDSSQSVHYRSDVLEILATINDPSVIPILQRIALEPTLQKRLRVEAVEILLWTQEDDLLVPPPERHHFPSSMLKDWLLKNDCPLTPLLASVIPFLEETVRNCGREDYSERYDEDEFDALESENFYGLRSKAAWALVELERLRNFPNQETTTLLRTIVVDEKEPVRLRVKAAQMLGGIKKNIVDFNIPPEVISVLKEFVFKGGEWSIDALRVLGKLKDHNAISALQEIAEKMPGTIGASGAKYFLNDLTETAQ